MTSPGGLADTLPLRRATPGSTTVTIAPRGGRPAVTVQLGDEGASELLVADGADITAAAHHALERRLPLVIEMATKGASATEGVAALDGWGRAAQAMVACSGVVPLVVVLTGPTTAGVSLLTGLADVVVMTSDAYTFVSGPQMVAEFTGISISNDDLGGAAVHARTSGLAHHVVADVAEARQVVDDLLCLLPPHSDAEPPRLACADPVDRDTDTAVATLPSTATGSYDVRDVIADVVDDGDLLELRAGWAANLVTTLATIDGNPVGVVANQPQTVAGTLDIGASQKGARFVGFCDAFNLPIVTFVDTSGFYPGKDLEWRGMIRYGAQLAFAYARATVPRVSVTLRKSYGGAYIVMDSKYMGNDMALAWPTAEIAVMGAKGAVEILHRRVDDDEREALIEAYEERLLNPYIAAERGSIDQVIDPLDTRRQVAAALDVLATKRERLPHRRHDNLPL